MGRRSRKRSAPSAQERREVAARDGESERSLGPRQPNGPPPPAWRTGASRRRRERMPPAPWHPFPLVELCVLISLGLGIAGFAVGGHRGQIMVAAAAVVGSLAGLEVAIREHLAGYRSHTMVLAGAGAVVVGAALFFSRAPWIAVLLAAAIVFAALAWRLRETFKRRSGGVGLR